MTQMFAKGEVQKSYLAIVTDKPQDTQARLTHYLVRNEKQNKSYAYHQERANSKRAELSYRLISNGEHYHLVEVDLHTGRHHQIRCQLSAIGCPIKGDLKYGAKRSNPDGKHFPLELSFALSSPREWRRPRYQSSPTQRKNMAGAWAVTSRLDYFA